MAGLQSTDSPNNEIAPRDQDTAIFGLPAVTNATGTLKQTATFSGPLSSLQVKNVFTPRELLFCLLFSRSHADRFLMSTPEISVT